MPLSDVFAALRWWAVLLVLGAAATPLALYFLGPLPDKGYAFSKMLGLLVVSYLFWLGGSLGFLGNNVGGMLLALLGLVALSAWAARRVIDETTKDQGPRTNVGLWSLVPGHFRRNWRTVLITELVFAVIFALWAWVRAQNPAITATEKPMEFAFLNAVGRSPSFPPLDPWLSDFAISYYYFGYVMTSVLARLTAVPEPVAFNLGIAWLAAGTAVGAYGLVYNLVAAGHDRRPPTADRRAVLLGLVAAVALPLAGNLEIGLEMLHGNGVGPAGFWQWLDVREISAPATTSPRYDSTEWWWWRSSRVIHEYQLGGRAEEGLEPIAEFPGFSFILGDMHPHVLALPFAFLSLGAALAWWLRLSLATADRRQPTTDGPLGRVKQLRRQIGVSRIGIMALILGGLSFLNTWDVLIHLFVVVGAYVLGQWRRHGRWRNDFLAQGAALAGVLAAGAFALYLPFYLGFRSQAGPPFLLPTLVRPTRLAHFLIIFGMPLSTILILLVGPMVVGRRSSVVGRNRARRHWQAGAVAAVALVGGLSLLMLFLGWVIASSGEGAGRVGNLAADVGVALPPYPAELSLAAQMGWGLSASVALVPAVVGARLAAPGVTLLLAGMIGLVVILLIGGLNREEATAPGERPVTDSALPFALLLVGTGALLTLAPEFVYLKDNFDARLNTIFKFYYQAWVMFGVAALFGLDYLQRRLRAAGVVATAVYGVALAVALAFPILAVRSRAIEYRGALTAETRQPATLNGLAYLQRAQPDEYAALLWLRQNVEGTPVVVEAVGGQYTGFGRVAASTGLPTLVGWAGHEYQWRGYRTAEPAERERAVETIYNSTDWESAAELLERYNVDYVYIGPLEMTRYNARGIAKFDGRLPVVYQSGNVTIYAYAMPIKEG